MFSVLAASAFLPFLPMLPIQILILNLIYDISCIAIPWDNVDNEYLKKPRTWNAKSITKFMIWFGPISSIFDIATFIIMYFLICPSMLGGAYHMLSADKQVVFAMLFNAGWFVESLWTQTFVIHLIRTKKMPFIKSRASWQLTTLSIVGIAVGTIIPYTFIGTAISMYPLPAMFFAYLAGIICAYTILVSVVKRMFVKKYGELL